MCSIVFPSTSFSHLMLIIAEHRSLRIVLGGLWVICQLLSSNQRNGRPAIKWFANSPRGPSGRH